MITFCKPAPFAWATKYSVDGPTTLIDNLANVNGFTKIFLSVHGVLYWPDAEDDLEQIVAGVPGVYFLVRGCDVALLS